MQTLDMPLTALRELLDARLITSSELAEECIARVAATRELNCFTRFSAHAIREDAGRADARLAAGTRLPLLGIPVALKDNIETTGFPCAAATSALADKQPREDADVVKRLRAAGAVVAGMLNMHELAFGITSNNAVTGAVRNPWNRERIAGGSSGGCGVAVAARLVPLAIGTDTGGSVRVPAALCGVTGFRPTVGRISAAGIVPISATRDTAGPLAQTVRDCAWVDQVLSGTPPLSVTSLKGIRIGLPGAPFWTELDPSVQDVAERALSALRRAGAQLVPLEIPGIAELDTASSFPVVLYEFVRDMRAYLASRERGVTLEALIDGVRSPDVRGAVGPLLAVARFRKPSICRPCSHGSN